MRQPSPFAAFLHVPAKRSASRAQRFRDALEKLEDRTLLAAHVVGSATVYSTIQAAVNAAPTNGVVTVDAGSYNETVTISKTLTLRGARWGVDARANGRVNGGTAGESIVTGALSGSTKKASFIISANNVVLDGFTVQGETSQSTSVGAGIVISPSKFGTQILNNVVQNNVAGIFLANSSSTIPAIIRQNVFRSNNNAGINGGRGIYTDGSISGGILQNVTIDNNAFFNNRGTSGTTGLESAIAFEAATAGKQTNIRITNNAMDGNGKAVLFFNTTNVTLTGNVVTYTLDKYSGTFRFEGNNQNFTIKNNTLYDNTGPAVAIDSKGVPGNNSGFVVTNNNIYGNSTGWSNNHLGVVSDGSTYSGTLDVRNNWWGAASGPGGDGPGTGDWVYGIGHVVSGSSWTVTKGGSELFSPWSTTPVGSSHGAYYGVAANTGAIVQAEDFDHGGEGYAYHDTTSGNAGNVYRVSERVDLQSTTDAGGGYNVYNTVAGEWLSYAMNVPQTGVYRADFRVAAAAAGAKFHLEIDGVNVTGSVAVPNTGGTQKWATVSASTSNITAGLHDLRLVFETNNSQGNAGSFNYFSLNLTTAAGTPTAPSALTANATSATSVLLTWADNSINETGFKIERQTGVDGVWTLVGTPVADATSFTDSTVVANTSYSYRVRATNAAGDSAASSFDPVTTPAVALAPTGLTAAASASDRVELAWTDASPGITTGFKIERSTDGVNFTPLTTVAASATTYSDTTATPNLTYTYRVKATGAGGDSGYSNTATATTPSANAVTTYLSNIAWTSATAGWGTTQLDETIVGNPLKIRGVTYAKGLGTHADSQIVYNLNGAYISFSATVGVDDEAKGVGSVQFQVVGDGVVLFDSGVVTNNDPAASVNISVAGVKTLTLLASNGGDGIDYDHADWADAKLLSSPALPVAPNGLAAAAVSGSQINLSWASTDPSVSGFSIERSTDGVTYAPIATVAATARTYSDTGLIAGTAYSYRIQANNAAGVSAYSNIATATTLAATSVTYLSDLQWVSATAGWGTVQLDKSITGNTITLGTTTYTKGLGTHADSTIVYNLAGQYTHFLSDIGMDARVIGRDAAVKFQVLGDNGVVLYDSGVMTDTAAAKSIDINVTGVQQLTLIVTTATPGDIDYCHGDWADARLV
jgi:hypothetical protein